MNTFKYTINLGKKSVKPHFFRKKIAWPVYAWKTILPSFLKEELDILQKLILSLAKINKLKDYTIFRQLGISSELIKTVQESCVQKGYLGLNNLITESGEQVLTNSMNVEQDMLMNYEQIYIFRDALTGDIIPNFKVSELPGEEKLQYDYVFEITSSNYRDQKPTFMDIGQALKIRQRINRITDVLQKDYANEVVDAEQLSSFDEMDFFIEEVDWQLIDEDGHIEYKSLKDKEEQTEIKKSEESTTTFKIVSIRSDILYLEADLYVDPDLPEKIMVTSPFGENEDDWFTKHMLLHAQKSDCLQEDIELFMLEAKEELIDKYPFNNYLDIELFRKYPSIANYENWKSLRSQIESTERSYNRLIEGDEDYDTFYMRAQRSLEGVLKYCIEKIPNKMDVMNSVTRYNFTDSLKRIAENLRIDIPSNLFSPDFYNRLKSVANNKGISSKDRALFLAFDAFYHQEETPSLQLLKNIPDFYKRINIITNVRNKTAHFTEEIETVESRNFTIIKQELDILLDSLIAYYLK
ncbi:hypothetical protein [Paenibacillus gallinarum]|uniref:Uncharacterized protein n=1 Tax=Paenibacillus gallinarum TaxID=2762232 RepID=A0ABR8T3S1_9BACL|nr:hypothetical protein [Paenibacillus gallinarum]MBD7970426.1 hypothetical protein [Paenibacillus gallinarum]